MAEGAPTAGELGSGRRPSLLFLCQTLPFPPDDGVSIRSYHTLRLLARHFDITALCFYRCGSRRNDAQVHRAVDGLSELAQVEAFPIPQEHSRARLLWDHGRSIATGRSYTRYTYSSADFRRRLREHLRAGRYTLAHVDSLDLSCYLPELRSLPVVCAHHNIESSLLSRRGRGSANRVLGAYYALQARLTAREERRWAPRVSLNVTVSAEDARQLTALTGAANVMVVPNGVDTRRFRPAATAPRRMVVFAGGAGWWPNRDAMQHLAETILPHVRSRLPDVIARWVGPVPSELRDQFARAYGVETTGYLPDITAAVQEAACYVVPLRVGGGTRLKILDAWALGKAVVSTSVGCEGLEAEDGANIVVRDDAQSFAEAVCRVLTDEAYRQRLEQGARATAERRYDWDVIGRAMLPAYERLAGARAEAARA